jgi:hypothetical protein
MRMIVEKMLWVSSRQMQGMAKKMSRKIWF